jgi:hypothetical protein
VCGDWIFVAFAAAIQDEVELPQRSTVWIAAISSNVFKLQQ